MPRMLSSFMPALQTFLHHTHKATLTSFKASRRALLLRCQVLLSTATLTIWMLHWVHQKRKVRCSLYCPYPQLIVVVCLPYLIIKSSLLLWRTCWKAEPDQITSRSKWVLAKNTDNPSHYWQSSIMQMESSPILRHLEDSEVLSRVTFPLLCFEHSE